MVSAGLYDVVLALGVEKLYHADKQHSRSPPSAAPSTSRRCRRSWRAEEGRRRARGAAAASSGAGEKRSMFMDIYAAAARAHMQRYGTTVAAVRRGRRPRTPTTAA